MRKFRSPDTGHEVVSRRRGSASPHKPMPQLFPQPLHHVPYHAEEGGQDKDQNIVIHVRDENRKVNKDFVCSQQKLLKHMKYFECYLTDGYDDLDISVHCDIEIFEWLMEYMSHPEKVKSLNVNSVISILVSSDFLQMADLVQQCLNYVKDTMNQVLRLPIDLSCLSPDLIKRLAAQLSDEEIEAIRDKKDKLQSRLFYHKVQRLATENSGLKLCTHCKQLFSQTDGKAYGLCAKAKITIGFHGLVIADHVPQSDWDAWSFAQYANKSDTLGLSWRALYWRLWGCVNTLHCDVCKQDFPARNINNCYYHPSPVVPGGDKGGRYPCCNQDYLNFDSSTPIKNNGCSTRKHVIGNPSQTLTKVVKFDELITAPFSAEIDSLLQQDPDEDKRSGCSESSDDDWVPRGGPTERFIPEHCKKHRRDKITAGGTTPTANHERKKDLSFFEIVIPCAQRRDMLREDDRRRVNELIRIRDQQFVSSKKPERLNDTRGSSKASESSGHLGMRGFHLRHLGGDRPISGQKILKKRSC